MSTWVFPHLSSPFRRLKTVYPRSQFCFASSTNLPSSPTCVSNLSIGYIFPFINFSILHSPTLLFRQRSGSTFIWKMSSSLMSLWSSPSIPIIIFVWSMTVFHFLFCRYYWIAPSLPLPRHLIRRKPNHRSFPCPRRPFHLHSGLMNSSLPFGLFSFLKSIPLHFLWLLWPSSKLDPGLFSRWFLYTIVSLMPQGPHLHPPERIQSPGCGFLSHFPLQ